MEQHKYKAFISYSHADERWGSWLHRKLERYKFPQAMIGHETLKGSVPKTFRPVFRDRDELTAGSNLGAEIQKNLQASENLIVLCSPQSAKSHWVNQEIIYFKRFNNPDNIFAFIIEGEPYSGGEDECFPDALKFRVDDDGNITDEREEPLAADAREQGDGPRIGLLKLLSGMAGLGLDDLVQRDLRRARRRVTWITLASITGMIVMGSLTWLALDARKEADARRGDAEGLIEFMLTDLRDKLEPVGRLDVLEAVGEKATDYYDGYEGNRLGADAVGRQATAYHLLGDIQLRLGNINAAKTYFEPIFETTQKQLEVDPDNPDRIYEHIQSVFWVAQPYERAGQDEEYLDYQQTYLRLAERLYDIEGDTDRAVQEMAYGLSNVGNSWSSLEKYSKADDFLNRSLRFFIINADRQKNVKSVLELSRRYNDIAFVKYNMMGPQSAYDQAQKAASLVQEVAVKHPNDFEILKLSINSLRVRTYYLIELEDFDHAKKLLEESLEKIDQALQVEPNDDGVLKQRLRVYSQLITIARHSGDQQKAVQFSEIYGELLDARIAQRTTYGFDREWDYERPKTRIRGQMGVHFMGGEFEAAKELLPKYETLLARIKDRDGYHDEYRSTNSFYLISKAFLNDDKMAYGELANVLSNRESDLYLNNVLIFTLLRHKFCRDDQSCFAPDYQITQEDLESPVFGFFKNKYPETAQTIEKETIISGREK